jgi:hypothetical protein
MTTKKGRGRPEYVPDEQTRKNVTVLAGVGVSHEVIANVVGISRPTLEKHYANELQYGSETANALVAANLFKQATKDDPKCVTAAMFWLKSRAGWNEHGPLPAAMREQKEKTEKLGKKEVADLLAQNPDEQTPMGALMMQRRATMQ